MYKKLVENINPGYLIAMCVILLCTLTILILYLYQKHLQLLSLLEANTYSQDLKMSLDAFVVSLSGGFLVTLFMMGILGLFIVFLIHTSRVQGFREGYQKGLHKSSSKES